MNTYTSVVMLWLCLVLSGCVSVPANPVPVITDETFGNYHEELEPELILITMTPEYHALYTELKPVPMSGELPPRYTTFLSRVESSYGLKRVANWPLPAIDIFCVVFEIKDSNDRKWMVAELAQEPDIETAQIVQSFNSQEQSYNDPYLSLQHGVYSTKAIGTHQWSRGKGARIAVIDTGMNDTHPDLVSSSEATMNFVDNDQAMFRSDTHGTAVGGVIAAEADNLKGMVGMAPDASLLALKACWHSLEDPSKALCNTLTLAKALNFSILQEVDIINMSLTGPPDPVLERLVLKALERDIIVVAAKPAHENEAFPVSIPGTITGAMPGDPSALLSAPGRHVLSTHPNGEYEFFDGSSFSTAHISGLAALLRSLSPGLAPSEFLSLLESTANPETGAVDACRAVDVVRRINDKTAIGSGCG